MKIAITHQNADFDGLAAMLGVRKLWPDYELVLGSSVSPPVKKYLALHRDWLTVRSTADLGDAEISEVVIVDSRDRRRFGEFSTSLEKAGRVVVFDHHPGGEYDLCADEAVVEPVGACTTLLCERIQDRQIQLSSQEATLLMLGIYADTGNLSFPSTTVRDLRAASFLLSRGAALTVVNRYLRQEYSPDQRRLLVSLLDGVNVLERQGLRIGYASCETVSYVRGASQVVERVLLLTGLDALFAVLQVGEKDTIQLIARSHTNHVDASTIAKLWDGGGHPSAAAARARESTRREVVEQLVKHLESLDIQPLTVGDIMSSPVQTIPADLTLEELKSSLDRWAITGVPVVDDDELVGIVSRRDVEAAARRKDWKIPVSGFMTHHVVTIEPEEPLSQALDVMTDADVGRLPVVCDGVLIGIVTRSDVLGRMYSDEHGSSL